MIEQVSPRGWGPPRHIHTREDEIFYVLDGSYELHVGDERRTISAGASAIVAPAYTRFDATSSWELAGPRLTLGLVAENLTNLRYVRSGASAVFFVGPPRRLAVQVTSAF